jgi:hypothetical protein
MLERDILNSELQRLKLSDQENPLAKKKAKAAKVVNHPKKVSITVNWSGVNNGLLDANVIVKNGKTILSSGHGTGNIVLEVDWAKKYQITIIPKFANLKNNKPDRMYDVTNSVLINTAPITGPDPAALSKNIELMVNRWNWIHVDASWTKKGVNRDLALDIKPAVFLGKKVTVNNLALPLINQTENAFKNPGIDYQRIINSIAKVGSRTLRTMTGTTGNYSNHSIGCALDVNEYMPTKQNHHFLEADEQKLLILVQQVVRDQLSGWETFDIKTAKNLVQLDASNHFANEFPKWLYTKAQLYSPFFSDSKVYFVEVPAIREYTEDRLKVMIKAAEQSGQKELKSHFETILKYKNILIAWEEGTMVNGVRLKGMIPLDRDFLKIMLDNKWRWGGNYNGLTKDYMHFEDMATVRQIEK